jgi:hypothetical protein
MGGCSLDASLTDLAKAPQFMFESSAKTTGLISGSSQAGTATGGGVTYYMQSTVGSYTSGIEQTTDDNAYKVYSSVQGAIISQ